MARSDGRHVRLGIAMLGVALLVFGGPLGSARSTLGPTGTPAGPDTANATLEVNPAHWQLEPGDAVNLTAGWIGAPPGCDLEPLWYHWSLPGADLTGMLNATWGPNVTFAADSIAGGPARVAVRSAATLSCGSVSDVELRSTEANVSDPVPMAITNLSIGPIPLLPGQVADLAGTVSGGVPPYALRVDWTDGSTTDAELYAPGPFRATHAFPAGSYRPSVSILDGNSAAESDEVPVTVDVSVGPAVAAWSAQTVADVGVPVAWNATISRAGVFAVTTPLCDGIPVFPLPVGDSVSGSCTFWALGPNTITVETGPVLLGAWAEATAYVNVVDPPEVSISAGPSPSEIDQPDYATVIVEGGAPPMWLASAGPALGAPGRTQLSGDGSVLLGLAPATVGELDLSVDVIDADGVSSGSAAIAIDVGPALVAAVNSSEIENGSDAAIYLVGSVGSGVAPFAWTVVPRSSAPGTSAASGTLAAPAEFEWSGSYRAEGPVGVDVLVVDAAGAVEFLPVEVGTFPPLDANSSFASGPPDEGASVLVDLALAGGDPPFNVSIDSSAGTFWNFSVGTDGSDHWRLSLGEAGPVAFELAVRDAAGTVVTDNATVEVEGTPPSSPSYGSDLYLAFAGLAVAAVLGIVLWRRRHLSVPPRATPDPVSVLREIIAPADGAERPTVELLAEEAGVPLATARSTLDRLIGDGCVVAETDDDGMEVVTWERDPPA